MNALIKPNIIKDKKIVLLIHEKTIMDKKRAFLIHENISCTINIHSCARELIMHKK